jgi:hypothetical protein
MSNDHPRKKYDTYKHRIDFYLLANGISDNSGYRLGMPPIEEGTNKINIEYWNYDRPKV